jgi:hypothetical protein
VFSSGIQSLIMSIPAKRVIVGTSISASSISGSLRGEPLLQQDDPRHRS